MTILDTILAHKRNEIEEAKKRIPLNELEEQACALSSGAPSRPRFSEALRREEQVAIIAEIKKASPSKGLIRPDFDPVELATIYAQEGAAAISVLTDERFFQGSLEHLAAVRRAVALPLLRKEFIIDEYQLYEAKVHGADAVLLIVAALEPERLERLYKTSAALGLDSLIEVHTERELETALALGASLIGINNRDLATFHTSLDVTAVNPVHTRSRHGRERERNFFARRHPLFGRAWGRRGVDRGSADPGARRGRQAPQLGRRGTGGMRRIVRVKVCGITRPQDADLAARMGADAIGLIFCESPRRVSLEQAREIVAALPPFVTPVGVFLDAAETEVLETARELGLGAVQLHGSEPPETVGRLSQFVKVIKAFRVQDAQSLEACTAYSGASAFLFDTYVKGKAGGTGQVFDWSLLAHVPALQATPWILAGGLRPDNVGRALEMCRPYGVDVSSGVEKEPGVKDPDLLWQFISKVRQFAYER